MAKKRKRNAKATRYKRMSKAQRFFCKKHMQMKRSDLRRYAKAGKWWHKHRKVLGVTPSAVSFWKRASRHAKNLLRIKKHKKRRCD